MLKVLQDARPSLCERAGAAEAKAMMGFRIDGILGLVILAADVWAIINIAQSGVSTGKGQVSLRALQRLFAARNLD
jgi:hypothetical protein